MKRIAAFGGACLFTIALLPSSTFANQGGGWGGNYPPPPPPPPSDYQQYQGGPPPPPQQGQRGGPPPSQPGGPRYPPQHMGGPSSEDQHGGWGGPPGQGGGGGQGRGPPPPSGYGYGARPPPPQQQQQQQQQEGGGFWTRLTNKIFAGGENDYPGSSQGGLGGEFSGWGGPSNQPPPPPALPPGPSHHQHQHHRPSQFAGGPPPSPFPAQQQQQEPGRSISTRPPWDRSAQGQQEQQQQQGPGFWGRISSKIVATTQNLLENKPDNGQQQGGGPGQQQGGYPGRGGPYGASPYGGHPQHQQPPMRGGPPQRPQGGPSFGGPPPPPPPGLQHQQYQPQLHQQHQQGGPFPPFEGGGGPMMMGGNPFLDQQGQQQAPPEDETEALPDIFTVGDNIVLVPNPKAMRIKIENFARGGVQNLEVLAAFDGAMKAYRTPDRKRKTESTETLVHNAVLLPASRSKIAAITEKFNHEYDSASSPEARYENREALKREVQRIVISDGQIYLSALPRAVHDFLGTVPLRPHMDQFLKPLAFHGIPLTLFCTGYGEVLTQILALSNPSLCTPEGYLPPNVRIVSNFFRTGADGIAMGFTDPVVHELNRNLTAARHFRSGMMMGLGGMNVPPRGPPQNLLVIGGSLADLDMAAGLTSRERPPPSHQLSVGFIDTDEKFLADLPKYLEHYDAIILGDGGLQYANHVIEQIVG